MALTGLPIELMHHVAWYCAPHDVLALTDTCRSLRNTYNDGFFRQAFEHKIPPVSSRSVASKKALVASITDQLNRNTQRPLQDRDDYHRAWWKRLAVAASHLSLLRGEMRRQVSAVTSEMGEDSLTGIVELSQKIEPLKRTMGLLATSVVWGCLSVCDEDVMRALDELCACAYSDKSENEAVEHLLNSSLGLETSFCVAICAIQNSRISPERQRDEMSDYEQDRVRIGFTQTAVRRYLDTSWENNTYGNVLPSMALLSCALAARACLHQNPKVENAPPPTENIPFFSHAGSQPSLDDPAPPVVNSGSAEIIPLPRVTTESKDEQGPSYSLPATCCWELWYKARTRALIDEIDSCEWEGLYTYGLRVRTRMDPLMRHIRFQKSSESDHRIEIVASECRDGIGNFKLEGSVDLETCGIMIQKRYTGRHGFQWRGAVTPLGIAGCYLSNWDENNPLGAFWLWRRDWKSGI